MNVRRPLRLLTAAVVGCALLVAPTAAQDGGVFVDPESPSAKEYGIPLEAARRGANPERSPKEKVQQGTRSEPLFGAGIGDDGSGGGSGASGGGQSGGGKGAESRSRSRSRDAARIDDLDDETRRVVQTAVKRPSAPSDGSMLPLLVAGGILFVAGAAGVGVAVRRRSPAGA